MIHDGMTLTAIQCQGQGHEGLKVAKCTKFQKLSSPTFRVGFDKCLLILLVHTDV